MHSSNFLFSKVVEKVHHFSWRHTFERVERLKGVCIKLLLIVTGSLSVEVGLTAVHFAQQCLKLKRNSGLLFMALYLKQCSVCLQRYYSRTDPRTLISTSDSVCVSLTRSALPRIIPVRHRHIISCRGERGDQLVKIYLSLFSISKLVQLAKPVTVATFDSIVKGTDVESLGPQYDVSSVVKDIESFVADMFRSYVPSITTIPLKLGLSWVPVWKSLPTSIEVRKDKRTPSIFTCFTRELAAFAPFDLFGGGGRITPIEASLCGKEELLPLDPSGYQWDYGPHLKEYQKSIAHLFNYAGRLLMNDYFPDETPFGGRLAQSLEGSGKRRIFSIGNYVRQRLLFPVHRWGMAVLKKIPMDGTFDQERPLRRLARFGPKDIWSYDLKSATDRFPVVIIEQLMKELFGTDLGRSLVRFCLACTDFYVGPPAFAVKPRKVHFEVGQPLGYYGSWALFALTHHYIVWMAAQLANPDRTRPFTHYALLGDDIVIADRAVAEKYKMLLEALDVTVSESKSLVSDTGTLEFAKRYWTKSLSKDFSPVSAKALTTARTSLGICALGCHYNVPFRVLLRLSGAGYRVMSRMNKRFDSPRWEKLRLISSKPGKGSLMPLSWWIAGGKPLDPYIWGVIRYRLVQAVRPKDLVVPPESEVSEAEFTILEYTVMQHWMKSWAKWYAWWAAISVQTDATIEDFLDAPICANRWDRTNKDSELVRFGLIWKCCDWFHTITRPLALEVGYEGPSAFVCHLQRIGHGLHWSGQVPVWLPILDVSSIPTLLPSGVWIIKNVSSITWIRYYRPVKELGHKSLGAPEITISL